RKNPESYREYGAGIFTDETAKGGQDKNFIKKHQPPSTWCVGQHQPGGLVGLSGPPPPVALPPRQGFVDVLFEKSTHDVFVLDSVLPALWKISAKEPTSYTIPLAGVVGQLVELGPGTVGVVTAYPPGIWVHLSHTGENVRVQWDTPQRAAVYDPARDILWTAGPAEPQARRNQGPLHQLSAAIFGWDAKSLRHGTLLLREKLLLGPLGLADPTSISVIQESILVTLGANNAVMWWRPGEEPVRCSTEPYPSFSLPFSGGVLVTSRLGDAVLWFPKTNVCVHQTVVIDPHPRDGLKYWGENLFYGLRDTVPHEDAPYTCNSCHWDTGKDHRLQPGFLEQRWEMTRSLAGIRAVLPLFTTGFGSSMADTVEGLLRGLDPRFWHTQPSHDSYWLKPAVIQTKGGLVELSAAQQRDALVHYLMSLLPQVGPLRLADGGFSAAAVKGATLFWDHCASCHQPRATLREPFGNEGEKVTTVDEMLVTLRSVPLVFGARAFAHLPEISSFTPHGNRIAPLFELWRGGPFFSDGSASDLRTVLSRFVPGSKVGHGPDRVSGKRFNDEEKELLWTFLMSL
ncbi:MAG: hypothetical protein HUU55_19955, partial [Myxococcales bacterium]|nr:hypothetical protein [Myxococcales bacterium]